jgi:hypothetical protein
MRQRRRPRAGRVSVMLGVLLDVLLGVLLGVDVSALRIIRDGWDGMQYRYGVGRGHP